MRPAASAPRWVHLLGVAALAATLSIGNSAWAQAFPSRPLTFSVPWSPGSNLEILLRALATEVSQQLGQPVIVDNRPGANQRLPIMGMQKAAPDGHYLANVSDALVVTQAIADPTLKFEAGRDYIPVALLVSFPLVLVAHPSLPFHDMKGLVAYAKANPGKLNLAGGPGSITQITAERMRQLGGFSWTFVPYKDTSVAVPDLLAGRVDLTITGSLIKPMIDTGKLNALATTGPARWSPFPSVPTLRESGLGMNAAVWYAVVVAPGTPAPVIARLNEVFNAALKAPAVVKRIAEYGYTASTLSPSQFESFIRSEIAAWSPIVKSAGIKMD